MAASGTHLARPAHMNQHRSGIRKAAHKADRADSDALMRDIDAARTDGANFEFRYRLRHKDGTHRWMASRGVVGRNEGGEAIRLTGRQWDITIEMVTDAATGLPNRLL